MTDLTPNSIGGHSFSKETTLLVDMLDLADRYRTKSKIFAKTPVADEQPVDGVHQRGALEVASAIGLPSVEG